jgi:hypothetical protein
MKVFLDFLIPSSPLRVRSGGFLQSLHHQHQFFVLYLDAVRRADLEPRLLKPKPTKVDPGKLGPELIEPELPPQRQPASQRTLLRLNSRSVLFPVTTRHPDPRQRYGHRLRLLLGLAPDQPEPEPGLGGTAHNAVFAGRLML